MASTISCYQHQCSRHFCRPFIEIDSPEILGRIVMDKVLACIGTVLRCPNPLHCMEQKTPRTARRIGHVLPLLWVHHLDAHIDDVTWCKELAVLLLSHTRHEVFEGIIHDPHVSPKKPNTFKRTNDDLEMLWGKF